MTTLTSTMIAVVLAAAGPAAAGQPAGPIDLDLAASHFEQGRRLGEAEGGRLWGVRLDGPILLVDRMSRAVVANHPDAEGRLVARGGVYTGTLPLDENVANTAVEWSGTRWTMLLWPLPDDRYRRGRLLVHEMFHRIQDQVGLPAQPNDCGHLDSRDGRLWMRMEWLALREALIRRDPERRAAVADALAFRRLRHELSGPAAALHEQRLEMNEGLAEYTGFRAGGLPAHVLADRAAIALEDYEGRQNFVRNFAYASGPAYGVLLDEAGATWRDGLEPASDLGRLLAAALRIEVDVITVDEALRRSGRYGGALVVAQETRREEQRQQRQAEFRARFADGPVLVLPVVGKMRYSFDPNAVEAFADVGTVYLTTRVVDWWGVLEVESGGALMVRDGALISRIVVPAPADGDGRPLVGDGWTLSLEPGWTVRLEVETGDWKVEQDS